MILTIASGKGGTGKTTLAVNMAAFLAETADRPVRLLDCDVEEPNDHLFVQPQFDRELPVRVMKPVWDHDRCTGCGRCAEACHYNAIAVVKERVVFFPEMCHACGVCSYVCPHEAVREQATQIGVVQLAEDGRFAFGHGMLNVGEALAPAVVESVKEHIAPEGTTIIDASPGTACPVVAALHGADVALLVTEPTPFGLNDLELAASLSLGLSVPTGIVVNRSDGEDEIIQDYAERVGLSVIGRIPFRRDYAETYARGELLVDHHPELSAALRGIWESASALEGTRPPDAPEVTFAEAEGTDALPQDGGHGAAPAELTVISGKGGTGKTTVAASLASLLPDKVMADCDVDAADLHLLLKPRVLESEEFIGGQKAVISPDACTACGQCAEACHFGAISAAGDAYRIDDLACEGCGLCGLICPVEAVTVSRAVTGRSYRSQTPYGPLAHARLGVAQENSGKLVTRVRNRAAEMARCFGAKRILADGSPGTGCPVIASIAGVDIALVVTEPTVAGVHDLERVLKLTHHFGVPALVCINKCDLNAEQAERIRRLARESASELIGEIPFDEAVNVALNAGRVLVEVDDGPAACAIQRLAGSICARLSG